MRTLRREGRVRAPGRGALLPRLLGQEDRGRGRSSPASSRSSATVRAHSAEKYLIYHSTLKRPCGQLIVVDDGYDLFLTMVLYPSFAWDEAAYHLEGDPEGRTFAEILVDVVAAEVIEPWGGGKWHLEISPRLESRARGLEWRAVAAYNAPGRPRSADGQSQNPRSPSSGESSHRTTHSLGRLS